MQRASTGAGAFYGAKDAIDTRNGQHLAHAGRPPDGHLRGCGVAESEVKAQIRRRSEARLAEHYQTPEHAFISLHGAACDNCLFLPETSCERGNRYLDRSVLVPTMERAEFAFFCP